ncbi:RNA polymerase sigma factor (sigma-70 family) [Chitinophaga dinghuensis]|uniref:RNA polymerase sigma factor (Sigma-70 family) n=1 Tax=Chitinophaga dinghuensis TaxID=1539050 RepID=A0A327VR68_9BACT|nr:RNA polymerase sigma factor [Chitinophaga dinghuensis]RAJ76569.1 RNA polymerase sigma factor (sigma-70 family) [Chitinophaga dinghuensis]
MNEHELWESYKSGEVNGLEELYGKYYRALSNYGYKFTHDQYCIEESIQDLFRKLWQNRRWMTQATAIKEYLYSSFRRILLGKLDYTPERFASDQATEHIPFHLQLSDEHPLFEGKKLEHRKERAQAMLGTLANRQREAIFLHYYEGLSDDSIAQIMNLQHTGAYKLIHRTMDHLRTKSGNFSLLVLLYLLKHT